MADRAKGHANSLITAAWAALLITALVAAGLYTFQVAAAEDESMSPTISQGDHFLISKRAYDFDPPQLGDVIVFTVPKSNARYARRIVGLPGHRIQMIASNLTINGDYIGLEGNDGEYREVLPNGASYKVRVIPKDWNDYWTPQYLVPEGHYFVLGDNRDYSVDSRAMDHVGFIAKESIVGKVTWRLWDGTRQQIDASAIN